MFYPEGVMCESLKQNKQAELISLEDLSGKTFFVPSYQRGFRWTRLQVKKLILDLCEFVDNKDFEKYCLQPIVVRKMDGNEYELIDGQQRLTAWYLIGEAYKHYDGKTKSDTFSNYALKYEGKAHFQKFLEKVRNCNEKDAQKYLEALKSYMEQHNINDIDSKNALQIIDFLLDGNLYEDIKGIKNIYNSLNEGNESNREKSVCVIWHELESKANQPDDEKVIEAFANINANKISLTDAELIKAILMRAYGYELKLTKKERKGLSDDIVDSMRAEREAIFTNQWENVERGLNNNSLWGFFMPNVKEYETRIEALFDIWYENQKSGANPILVSDGDHVLYRAVDKYLNKSGSDLLAENLWKEIIQIYETLEDWYSNYFYYHIIGCYSAIEKNIKGAGLVKSLYCDYNSGTKSSFRSKLCSKLKMALYAKLNVDSNKNKNTDNVTWDDIESLIRTLKYNDGDRTIIALLCFNIALLVNTNNVVSQSKNEWFPFYYFKKLRSNGKIQLEHIYAQNYKGPQEGLWSKEEIDQISNMALIDSSLNESIGNGNFFEKRDIVLRAMLGENKKSEPDKYYEESVLFPGTRCVFLRMWHTDDDGKTTYNCDNNTPFHEIVWTKDDGKYYLDFICSSIRKLLDV
jgi:hypothetical protein